MNTNSATTPAATCAARGGSARRRRVNVRPEGGRWESKEEMEG